MQNLTLAETITELLYQTGLNPTSYPLWRNLVNMVTSLQDEKEALQKQAILTEEYKKALFNIIDQKVAEIVNTAVDYNENHIDSHGIYADLVADDYVYCNRQKELIAFCAENDLDLTDIDIEALENNLFDIMRGDQYMDFVAAHTMINLY